jgi:ATP phosphoribosyltransferase regulatory subunit
MNDAADVFKTLRADELAVLKLRTLYEQYGYKKFSMGKFEEYDFYAENRDFLPNNRILTFNDADGKLMALRPDVTMSIVKKTKAGKNGCEKLYYTENVYRAAKGASEYRETFQVGIEHIGAVTPYTNIELATLAVRSLNILGRKTCWTFPTWGF